MWALRALGVRQVFAPCAVGSLTTDHAPGAVVVPDQLVDRTRRRADTYFDSGAAHVSFADPYCPTLRAAVTGLPGVVDGGTMVVIEGPRFSTRAESQWFAAAGFTLINMTGYPEAVLARELEICYAAIALVTDLDAGIEAGAGVKVDDVIGEFAKNIEPFKKLVRDAVGRVGAEHTCHGLPVAHRDAAPVRRGVEVSRPLTPACARRRRPVAAAAAPVAACRSARGKGRPGRRCRRRATASRGAGAA